MLLRTVRAVSPDLLASDKVMAPLELPLSPELRVSLGEHGPGFGLLIEQLVDPARIEVVPSGMWTVLEDGEREAVPSLRVTEDRVLIDDFLSAVAFVTGARLSLGTIHERRLVPEGRDEELLLEQFVTQELFTERRATGSTRTFSGKADNERVAALLQRAPGVRLYRDAHGLPPVPRFRELWRVLESAFAMTGADLVWLLASYPPAKRLGFDETELEELRTLRGRASHAHSRAGAGTAELVAVDRECSALVSRLDSLVERVVLTKKSWGRPTHGVEELAFLFAYIGRRGGLCIVNPPQSDEDSP